MLITKYLNIENTAKEQAKVLQELIDSCSKDGGGKIIFAKGEYLLTTVFLKSNVHLYLEEGAVINGSTNYYDYQPQEQRDFPLYQDASHSYFDHSLFVAKNCENVSITGKGKIDMQSIWDEDGVRGKEIKCRGPKCITLLECKNVQISGLDIQNVTDLAIYFTACENVDIFDIKMRVYIDGISPDNSKNVRIHDCDIESGDDGIVLKSSYNMNRLDICKDIHIYNCKVKSRCNALKLGTETNGGFENILIENIDVRETRISGIAIESVDGAIIDGVTIRNVNMTNVNAPIFIYLGDRLRGPKGTKIGKIKNITLENITAKGPYEEYDVIAWNYYSFKDNNTHQKPWVFGIAECFDDTDSGNTRYSDWQMTSNVCGLEGYPLENITLKNVHLHLDGGVKEYNKNVPEQPIVAYPEVFVYGRILPAKGIFFRHINGLKLENVTVTTDRPDVREDFVFSDVTF